MFKVTPAAAAQIKQAAVEGKMENMSLRLAAKQNPDGSLQYLMGFDNSNPEDLIIHCEGVDILIAPDYKTLLQGTTMDFGEVDGTRVFIFLNPNDANYKPAEAE